jgi:chromosome segregation ATPase
MADQLAQLQIKLLDSMVSHLKQKRRDVATMMSNDAAETARINKEMAEINKKLSPIVSDLDAKTKARDSLLEQIRLCRQQFSQMMEVSKGYLDKGKKLESKLTSQQVSFGLTTLRGYSMESKQKPGSSSTLKNSAKMMFTF